MTKPKSLDRQSFTITVETDTDSLSELSSRLDSLMELIGEDNYYTEDYGSFVIEAKKGSKILFKHEAPVNTYRVATYMNIEATSSQAAISEVEKILADANVASYDIDEAYIY